MTTDKRTPAEIERDIERERAELTDTLDDLQDRFSVDTLVRSVSDQFRNHGGDYSRAINQSIKDNPIALAITGIGLGWLILGSSQKKVVTAYGTDRDYADERMRRGADTSLYAPDATPRPVGSMAGTGSDSAPSATGATDGGYAGSASGGYAPPASRGYPSPAYGGAARSGTPTPSWSYAGYDRGDDYDDAFDDDGHYVGASDDGSDGPGLMERIGDAAQGAKDAVTGAATGARDRMSATGQSAASGIRDRRQAAARRAEAMRRRLHEGTEELSENARRRVVMARYRAIEARDASMRNLRRGQDRAMAFYEEQPLVVGAMALAVGAAVAGALPRTRTEDAYLGEQRDHLMHEAERVFEEERSKIGNVANAAATEARKIVEETRDDAEGQAGSGRTLADEAADRAKTAGQRVAGAARDEAERQDLGAGVDSATKV